MWNGNADVYVFYIEVLCTLLTRIQLVSLLIQSRSGLRPPIVSDNGWIWADLVYIPWVSPSFRVLRVALCFPIRSEIDVFIFRWYWLWGGILAPIVGAQVGVGLYDVLLRRVPTDDRDDDEVLPDDR